MATPRMTWTVEDAGPYVVVRTAGVFDVADHESMVGDILSRPFWRSGRDAFFDHRALTFRGTDYVLMSQAAETHRRYDQEIGAGRAAILMGNPADYGVGRIFDSLTDDGVLAEVRIFSEAASAEAWLATPRDAAPPGPTA